LKELIEEFGQIKAIRIYFEECSDEFLNKVYKDKKFAKNIIKDPLTGKRFDRTYRPKNREQLVNWLTRNLRKPLHYFKNLSSNQLWAMYEKNLIQNNFKKQLMSSDIEWHRYRLIIKTKGNRKFLRLITIKRDDLISASSDFSSSAIVRGEENSLIVKNEFNLIEFYKILKKVSEKFSYGVKIVGSSFYLNIDGFTFCRLFDNIDVAIASKDFSSQLEEIDYNSFFEMFRKELTSYAARIEESKKSIKYRDIIFEEKKITKRIEIIRIDPSLIYAGSINFFRCVDDLRFAKSLFPFSQSPKVSKVYTTARNRTLSILRVIDEEMFKEFVKKAEELKGKLSWQDISFIVEKIRKGIGFSLLSKNEFLEKYRQYYADLWIRSISKTSSPVEAQNSFLEDVFRWLSDVEKIERGLNKIVKILKKPERIIEFEISIRMDKGEEKKFKAWRVVSNTALGPGKGGVRFDEDVSLSEIKGLSLLMPLKCACVGLNLGGAKGGIRVNPRELSKRELALLSRGYVRGIYKFIGPYKDIPAPDLGTNSLIMSWFEDEYIRILVENQDYSSLGGEEILVEFSKDFPFLEERIKNPVNTPYLDKFLEIIEKNRLLPTFVLGAFTGKRIEKGGSYVREEATALGVYFATAKVLELMGEVFTLKRTLKNLRVAIQGYGNVGRNAAYIFSKAGAKVIGISTIEGGLYNPKGLDLEDIDRYIEKYSALKGYPKAQFITNEELLKLNTDVLIPAACENQITKENAPFIETPLIIEAANHPVTYEAEKILKERGIFIVPDIIANPGGVIVSSFEWIQNVEGEKWEKITVEEMLREYIYSTVKEVLNLGKEKKISLREASYILALRRIRDAQFPQEIKLTRGFVPYTVEVLNQIVEKKKFKKFIENFEIAFSEKIEEIASWIEEKAFRSRESPLIVFVYGAVCIGKYTVAERIRKVLENRGKKVKHYSIDRNTQEGFLLLKEGYRVGKINPKELDILIVSGASLNEELVNSVAKERRFSILCYLAPSLKLATKEPLVSVNLRLLRRLLEFKNKNKNPLDAIRLHIAERTCYIGIYPLWWKEKDIAINCYNPYELIPFKKYAGEILRESHIKAKEENDTRSIKKIEHLLLILQDLRPLEKEDEAFISQDSLIRQFLPSASSGIDTRKERLKIKEAEEKDLDIWFRKERKLSRLMWKIELEKISQFEEDTPVLVIFLKAVIDDEIVGVVLAYEDYIYLRARSGEYFDEEAIKIVLIEVDRDYGSGIGRILVKEVERRGLGLPLWAHQVLPEARESFSRCGFRPIAGDEWRKETSSPCVNIRNSEAEIWRYPSLKKVMERLSKVSPRIGHIYNVNKHSLVAVKILDLTGGKAEEIKEEFPKFYKLWKERDFRLLKGAYEEIKKEGYLWLLRLATLLHDIGKLTQEEAKSKEYKELLKLDHPERGAILAEPVLEELGLNEEEKDFIIWLIRNHNYLNYFASTYIYQMDELALLDLVNKVEPRKYHTLELSSLYLLSWADRVAMNPEFPDIFGLYIHYERLSKWYKRGKIKIDELYKGRQTLEGWEENLRKNIRNLIISYYGETEAIQICLKLLLEYDVYDLESYFMK